MSRLRFLLPLAAAFALAVSLAACGGGGSSNENPQQVVEEATLKGVHSADVDLSLKVNAKGKEGGHLNASLSGPFEEGEGAEEGAGKLPQLDMTAKAKGSFSGEKVDFAGGLTLLPNKAYVEFKGTEYEVDPSTFAFVKQALVQAQRGGKAGLPSLSACQKALDNLKVSDFVENLSNEGSADVGGASTTKISGDLDVSGAIDALTRMTKDRECGAQLGSLGSLPSPAELKQQEGEVKRGVKRAHAELYVGEDHIVRRIVAQLLVEPPKGEGPQKVTLDFELTLNGVNEEQEISAPQGAKPITALFSQLGINPLEALGELSGKGNGEGLGSLLEGLQGATGGGGAGTGGASAGGGSAGGAAQAYLNCLRNASSAADVQKCAQLRK